MKFNVPDTFEIALELSPGAAAPVRKNPVPRLVYCICSPNRKQPRFKHRLLLEPQIDLGRYECKAAVDWIWFEVKLARPTQSIHLQRLIRQEIGRKALVTAPDCDHDVGQGDVWNHTGDEFRVKLQDPTPGEIRTVAGAIERVHGSRKRARLIGIEIAIDFYPAPAVADDEIEADRQRMVAILQRHHLADWKLFGGPRDDLRQTYPSRITGRSSETLFVVSDPSRPLSGSRALSDSQCAVPEVRDRIFMIGDGQPPYVDATLYRGARGAAIAYRVQNKVTDGSDPDRDEDGFLPPRKRRARIEVTLLGDGVTRMGLGTLGGLFGFNFVRLRKRLFPFFRPTTPGGTTGTRRVLEVVNRAWARNYRRAFVQGGCYATTLMDKARRKVKRKRNRSRDDKAPPRRRHRIGRKEHLVEWREMNGRCSRALERLAERWRDS